MPHPFTPSIVVDYLSVVLSLNGKDILATLREYSLHCLILTESTVNGEWISALAELFFKHPSTISKDLFASVEEVYLLCYAIVILNIDRHSPKNRIKMKRSEFLSCTQTALPNLPSTVFNDIFDQIKKEKIVFDGRKHFHSSEPLFVGKVLDSPSRLVVCNTCLTF